ncbi:monocarboxylate transporter 14-like [Glandiceps talaboti]
MSLVMQLLISEYGWRGALTILSALNLNICTAGLLFRPVDMYQRQGKYKHNCSELSNTQFTTSEETQNGSMQSINENATESENRSITCDTDIDNNSTDEPMQVQTEKSCVKDEEVKSRQICSESCRSSIAKLKMVYKATFDWSLFRNLAFVLILISGFGTHAGNYAVISHIVKRGRDYGISSLRSSSLPALMGLTQFLGRIFWGVLDGVSKNSHPIILYGGSITAAGILTVIGIRVPNYTGWMRDIHGNYDVAFYIIAASFFVSAVCAFFTPVAENVGKLSIHTSIFSKQNSMLDPLDLNI